MIRAKLLTVVMIFLAVLALAPYAIPTIHAASDNIVENGGFEEDAVWETGSVGGGSASRQDSTYKYEGNYSGLTDTTDPSQESSSGRLTQSLDQPALNLSTLSYRIRKGDNASDGYESAEVFIRLSGNRYLHYYHELNSGKFPMPSDTSNHKYISVGSLPIKNVWTQVSRNLYNDIYNKFGGLGVLNVTYVDFYSFGFKDLETNERWGQRINWDDITMPTVNAPALTEAAQNSGFESDSVWSETDAGGGSSLRRDSTTKNSGSYSGKTEVLNPTAEDCDGALHQNVNIPVRNVTTFSYFLNKSSDTAEDGYASGQVHIRLQKAAAYKRLIYYHTFNAGEWPVPSDEPDIKYVSLPDPSTDTWREVTRNLFSDLGSKFGDSIVDYNVIKVSFYSMGFKNLTSGEKWGQIVNWDDVSMPIT